MTCLRVFVQISTFIQKGLPHHRVKEGMLGHILVYGVRDSSAPPSSVPGNPGHRVPCHVQPPRPAIECGQTCPMLEPRSEHNIITCKATIPFTRSSSWFCADCSCDSMSPNIFTCWNIPSICVPFGCRLRTRPSVIGTVIRLF